MQFGNRDTFAVECLVDYAMAELPEPARAVPGRIRVWIGGDPIGDLDDYGVFIGAVIEHLEGFKAIGGIGWDATLEPMTPEDRFAVLDWAGFGLDLPARIADRQAGPLEELERSLQNTVPLMNIVSSFDDWKVFLVEEPSTSRIQWLWKHRGDGAVQSFEIERDHMVAALEEVRAWFDEVDRDWGEGMEG